VSSFIYLDNNATTQIAPEVLEAMLPYLRQAYGNPASTQYALGREASRAVEKARAQVADKLNARESEIYFNSGATEGINTVLRGIAAAYFRKGKHIVTCVTEHKAVLETCAQLERQGAEITYLPVDKNGMLDLRLLKTAIRPDTVLVSLMAANNETGVLHPLDEIAEICAERGVLFFCDATQAIGKENIDLQRTRIDVLVGSSHKFHGPKGVGFLFVRRKSRPIQVPALISGGKQENGLRGGTLNVPNIVGCGKALEMAEKHPQVKARRDRLEQAVLASIPETFRNGHPENRLDNTANIAFRHVRSAELMTTLPQIALSSGSACSSGLLDPSHVLLAMGLSRQDASAAIRFSLSRYTTDREVETAIQAVERAVAALRAASPVWELFLTSSPR